jgi:hypothetical protein
MPPDHHPTFMSRALSGGRTSVHVTRRNDRIRDPSVDLRERRGCERNGTQSGDSSRGRWRPCVDRASPTPGQVRPTAERRFRELLASPPWPEILRARAAKLDAVRLQADVDDLAESGRDPRQTFAVIRAAFRQAVRWKLLRYSPRRRCGASEPAPTGAHAPDTREARPAPRRRRGRRSAGCTSRRRSRPASTPASCRDRPATRVRTSARRVSTRPARGRSSGCRCDRRGSRECVRRRIR